MPSVIRDFAPADLDAAHRLDQSCFEPGIAYSKREIRAFLARPGTVALVAEDGSRMAGFSIANRSGSSGHLVTLDVAMADRRRGLGERLLNETLRRLRVAGAREVGLEVDVGNRGAIRFYEKMGFGRTAVLEDYYGNGRDGWEMVKEL
jgi:ribosomal-protein-alanine N-acetyltransferase